MLLAVLAAASTLAILARRSASEEPQGVTRVTDGRVVVGVVGALTVRPDATDRLLLRGLRFWQTKVAAAGGIPYQANGQRKAALTLLSADSHGNATDASKAAAALLRRGANVLIGPSGAYGTAVVANQARAHGALFLSSERRPLIVPADSLSRFLTPARLGDFTGALDAFNASRPPIRHPKLVRVAVASAIGGWSVPAHRTLDLLRARGYTARQFRFGPRADVSALQQSIARFDPDIVLVSAPYRAAIRIADTPRFDHAQLVAVPARTIQEVDALAPTRAVVVALPWSPSQGQGGPLFPSGDLQSEHEEVFGALPRYPVAAGASLGELLSASILRVQSTDMSRVVRGIDQLTVGSPAGLLRFAHGDQVAPSSTAVIAGPGGPPRHLWPPPAAPGYRLGRLVVRPTGRPAP